jgi:hypothetical protein
MQEHRNRPYGPAGRNQMKKLFIFRSFTPGLRPSGMRGFPGCGDFRDEGIARDRFSGSGRFSLLRDMP